MEKLSAILLSTLLLAPSPAFAVPFGRTGGTFEQCDRNRYTERYIPGYYNKYGQYVGGYVNESLNGQGKYTFPDGSILIGEFRDGEFWNGNEYNKDGNLTGKYVNGKHKTNKPQYSTPSSPASNPH